MILPLTEEVYSWICFNNHLPYFGHGDTKAIFFFSLFIWVLSRSAPYLG